METLNSKKQQEQPTNSNYSENRILEAIYERRAIRKYKDTRVAPELIEKVLEAGRMAPSALNKQPWKFYLLTDNDHIASFSKEISKAAANELLKEGPIKVLKNLLGTLKFSSFTKFIKEHDPVFHGAPVVVFISAPKDNEWAALDIGMCSQNIMLAAWSLGLDSCPVGFGKYVAHTKLYSTMDVPDSEQIHLAIILGYGDEKPEIHPREHNNASYIDGNFPHQNA